VTTGLTTALSVLGGDAAYPESALTYHWTVTGPPGVTLSNSGTNNAAKNNIATFASSGTYHFTATITNPAGGYITSSIDVVVNPDYTGGGSVTVTPPTLSVLPSNQGQFTATAYDQFGHKLDVQPAFSWTVSGGGSINSTGLFTAGNVPGGPYTVTATAGVHSGTAQVTVASDNPTVAQAASANPNPVTTGLTTALSVLGGDAAYPESALTYHWTVTGPAGVTLSNSGTNNAAKNNIATFTSTGTYHFTANDRQPDRSQYRFQH